MMLSPYAFLSKYETASYLDLLKLKNELIQKIVVFENDYDHKNLNWEINPSPDVHYQWNLKVLGKVCSMLCEAFNEEYEMGDKSISDYYGEMKEKKS